LIKGFLGFAWVLEVGVIEVGLIVGVAVGDDSGMFVKTINSEGVQDSMLRSLILMESWSKLKFK